MEQAFLRLGAHDVGRHHGYVATDLPAYATIRNPVTQVLSHYWRVKDKLTLEQYVAQRTPRLNLHHAVIDRYFIYEQGLTAIFVQLGYPAVRIDRIGATGADKSFLTPERIELINETFADDIALYRSVLNAHPVNRAPG